jgi:predicted nucleic acid-binding protein
MPDPVFLDTSGLIALIRRKDTMHRQATRVFAQFGDGNTPLVTSEWVLAEFLASAARPLLREAAIAVTDELRDSSLALVVASGRRSFAAALDLFRSRPDKEWSLVDCSSILICETRRVRRVFTHDHHFKQAGLDTLLR